MTTENIFDPYINTKPAGLLISADTKTQTYYVCPDCPIAKLDQNNIKEGCRRSCSKESQNSCQVVADKISESISP